VRSLNFCIGLLIPVFVFAVDAVPVRPSEAGTGALPQRARAVGAGGAQEPGLLDVRAAAHQHRAAPHQGPLPAHVSAARGATEISWAR
jgi:hypothetical protein